MRRGLRTAAAAVALAALLLPAGCGDDEPDGGPPTPTPGSGTASPPVAGPPMAGPSGAPTAEATPPTGGAPPVAGPDVPAWTTGPATVTREVGAGSLPQLLRIRSAAHPDEGYDRIVFDFAQELPGYEVRYVDEVRRDGSGSPVTMPGRRYLLVRFHPAQAHTDAGTPLVSPTRDTVDHPMLRGYVLVGDFEGYVTVALGLDDVVGFRVGELPGAPGRIYVDVAA
jgi:hypothetical protein